MKVVGTSNHGLETFKEFVVSVRGLSKEDAQAIADNLNAGATDLTPVWYTVVEDDYGPWGGMAELV